MSRSSTRPPVPTGGPDLGSSDLGSADPGSADVGSRPSGLLAAGRRIGVRARSVLVAVGVVLIALLIGIAALLAIVQNDLDQTAEANARARASQVVAGLSTDGLAATARAITDRTHPTSIVSILDADQTVVAASTPEVDGGALSSQRPPVGSYTVDEVDLDIRHDVGGQWKVVTTATRLGGATYYVQAAVPISEQLHTIRTVALLLLVGTPLLLLAVAVAVWMLVGRALRSVETIRATVAEIDAQRLTRRITVPPTQDEIAALAATMNTMLDRLEASDQAQRTFVSDASHELRSPLATLTAAGELAASATPERQTELVSTMNDEISRLRGLVDNLMVLARADAHALGLRRVEVDVDDLVAAEARRIRLTDAVAVTVSVVPARVRADEQQLAQALRNLVDNAVRHAASAVRLTLRATTTTAVVWVDNDGPVVPMADRERIFERFVRRDAARTRDGGGSGLGLSISRATMQAHGGEVSVVDDPGGWCRFELWLPLDPAADGGAPSPG